MKLLNQAALPATQNGRAVDTAGVTVRYARNVSQRTYSNLLAMYPANRAACISQDVNRAVLQVIVLAMVDRYKCLIITLRNGIEYSNTT